MIAIPLYNNKNSINICYGFGDMIHCEFGSWNFCFSDQFSSDMISWSEQFGSDGYLQWNGKP